LLFEAFVGVIVGFKSFVKFIMSFEFKKLLTIYWEYFESFDPITADLLCVLKFIGFYFVENGISKLKLLVFVLN